MNNLTNNVTNVMFVSGPTITITVQIASCFFSFIGITGNLLTIVALLQSAKLRVQATTTFVISLAVSDLLFCSINIPLFPLIYTKDIKVVKEIKGRFF